MSIITDALKKAEYERELRAKQAPEKSTVDVLLEQTEDLETSLAGVGTVPSEREDIVIPSTSTPTLGRPSGVSSFRLTEILILVAIFAICFSVLFFLTRWPSVGKKFSGDAFIGIGSVGNTSPQGNVSSSAAQKSRLPYVLSGISAFEQNRYALINGSIVQQGDSIDGARVKEILEREVILETPLGETRLKIPS